MSEWWTYSLSDFLLFSPRAYYRLFELYNLDVWPLHLLALALGVAILALLRGGKPWQGRVIAGILAIAWLWVAWAYHQQRYATINWAANIFAAAFALEALLLIASGVLHTGVTFVAAPDAVKRIGAVVMLFALVVQPLVGPLAGRRWTEMEFFGLAPDPTTIATLGIVLAADKVRWYLVVIPVAWCAISGATLWAMGSPDFALLPLVALLVAGAAWACRR